MRSAAVDISVVIVSWNTRDLLVRCLHSVAGDARRSGLRVETIVVDNASSDGSAGAARQDAPDIRVIELTENIGFAAATNTGLREASGEAMLILNPDTEVQPGGLLAMWNALHASPRVGMVGPVLLNSNGTFQSAGYRFPGLRQVFFDLFPLHPRLVGSSLNGRFPAGDGLTPFAIDHPLGACMLVRREVAERIGGLDEQFFLYSEEIDWCRRIRDAGWLILTAPAARVVHHGGQSTRQASVAMFEQLHRSRGIYFRRYHSSWFLRAARGMIRLAAGLRRRNARGLGLDRPASDYERIAVYYGTAEPDRG